MRLTSVDRCREPLPHPVRPEQRQHVVGHGVGVVGGDHAEVVHRQPGRPQRTDARTPRTGLRAGRRAGVGGALVRARRQRLSGRGRLLQRRRLGCRGAGDGRLEQLGPPCRRPCRRRSSGPLRGARACYLPGRCPNGRAAYPAVLRAHLPSRVGAQRARPARTRAAARSATRPCGARSASRAGRSADHVGPPRRASGRRRRVRPRARRPAPRGRRCAHRSVRCAGKRSATRRACRCRRQSRGAAGGGRRSARAAGARRSSPAGSRCSRRSAGSRPCRARRRDAARSRPASSPACASLRGRARAPRRPRCPPRCGRS